MQIMIGMVKNMIYKRLLGILIAMIVLVSLNPIEIQAEKTEDRYFFLIIAPDGRIIGESIINEIDWKLRRANFRIAIFHSTERR